MSDRHEQDLDFLARSATEFVDLSPDEDIPAFAGRRLYEVVGDAIVIVADYDPVARVMTGWATFGPPEAIARWREADPLIMGGSVSLIEPAMAALRTGRLVEIPGGIDLVSMGRIPPERARALEAAIGFRRGLSMGFTLHGEVYGSLLLVERQGTQLPDRRVIEAFVNQAAAAVHRRRAEQALKQAEAARQRVEAQLQHAEKLESLAVLAGGLAHDYNNLLVAILGNAELALTSLKPGSVSFERVRKIQNAARRAAGLTDQLLDYSGRRHFALRALALNDLVREACAYPQGVLARPGTLALELADPLPALEGDPAQVRQVLANLLSNATEAIAAPGGTVTVRTGVMRGDDPSLRDAYLGKELLPQEHVYLEVADTGAGMDEATRARVFDPFFTTKFPGRGLGLAAVFGIVRAHRGAIQMDSAPGRGTTFRVLFRVASRGDDATAG